MYRNAARGGLSNVHKKFGEVWPCDFRVMRVDEQRDIHVLIAVCHVPLLGAKYR